MEERRIWGDRRREKGVWMAVKEDEKWKEDDKEEEERMKEDSKK